MRKGVTSVIEVTPLRFYRLPVTVLSTGFPFPILSPGFYGVRHSNRALQEHLDFVSVAARRREPRAVVQDDGVIALEQRLELLDAVLAHDDRAMDAQEL